MFVHASEYPLRCVLSARLAYVRLSGVLASIAFPFVYQSGSGVISASRDQQEMEILLLASRSSIVASKLRPMLFGGPSLLS